jgi:hypothetical protein
MPSGPRAILCEIMRRPALAAEKCENPGLPRTLAEAPVKITAPRPNGTSRRAASRANQESAEAADAPEILELPRRQFAEFDALIIAGIGDNEVRGLEAVARRHRAVEQPHDILLKRRIRRDGFSAAPRANDRLGDLVEAAVRPATRT